MDVRKTRAAIAAAVWALCATSALAQTNIEFIQWWEPEMPAGALRCAASTPPEPCVPATTAKPPRRSPTGSPLRRRSGTMS